MLPLQLRPIILLLSSLLEFSHFNFIYQITLTSTLPFFPEATKMKFADFFACALFAASASFTLANPTADDANNGRLAERGELSGSLRRGLTRRHDRDID